MENPKTVVDAILNEGKTNDISIDIKSYPMTIRRYAFLEKIDSPFLNPDVKFSVNTILPSLYVACSDNETLRKYAAYKQSDIDKLYNDAYEWSDNIQIDFIPQLITSVTDQLLEMNKVSPTQRESDPAKKN